MRPKAGLLALTEIGLLVLAICGTVALWARPLRLDWQEVVTVVGQALIPAFCFVIAFHYNDLYDLRIVRNFSEFSVRLPRALGISFALLAVIYTLFPSAGLATGPFPSGLWGLVVVMGLVLPLRGGLYATLQTCAFAERILILGTNPLAWQIAKEIKAASPLSSMIVGCVADGEVPPRNLLSPVYPVLGSLDRLEQIIAEARPDRIIVALTERRGRLPVRALLNARMTGILVEDGIEVHERLTGKLAIESLTPSFLIFSKDFKKSRLQTALRRAVSLTVAAIGLVLTLPLMALIAVAIKLDSEGPVFFFQDRVGLGGQSFRLVKFRTMHPVNVETSAWARDNNERITRVGKWLRKFRLDEFPQFINILRGDMNLVGPRPHPVSNFALFAENIPYYSLRSVVCPGITGWAQVRYQYANNLEEETEKMRYDLFYIKNLSLWLDLWILIDTVKNITESMRTTLSPPRDAIAVPRQPGLISQAVDPVTLKMVGGLKQSTSSSTP